MKQPDGVGAAANGGDEQIGQPPFLFENLRPGFNTDDALEIAHQFGIGVRACRRADDVESVVDVGHPVPERLVHRILKCA